MTDKRKDEMPEVVWVDGNAPDPDIQKIIGKYWVSEVDNGTQKYVRADLTPKIEDAEVREAIKRVEYSLANEITFGLGDILTLIRAASAPDAGLVRLANNVLLSWDRGDITAKGTALLELKEALAKLEVK